MSPEFPLKPNTVHRQRSTPMKIFLLLAAVCLTFFECGELWAAQLQNGDIIFQTSHSTQSLAIQKATHSKYNHVGIVFFRAGKAYVFEAAKTVRYTPLDKWLAQGSGGHCAVKRLHDAKRIINTGNLAKLRQAAARLQGKLYDPMFEWSDERIYCSELVWKIYKQGLGIRVGRLRKLRDFDLSDPIVKAMLKERYGSNVPMNETVVSPGDIFVSDNLADVEWH
jgi:hypothetical protein